MMISNSSTNPKQRSTGVAALLYWLLIVCGLAGITMVRFDQPENLVALWFGSIVGVSIGQILALLRVRAWVPIVATCGSIWFVGALLLVVFDRMFGALAAEAAILTLLPATICGYLSLSERGGLVAFWFPAMLWMLVILDGGGSAGVFATGSRCALAVVWSCAARDPWRANSAANLAFTGYFAAFVECAPWCRLSFVDRVDRAASLADRLRTTSTCVARCLAAHGTEHR
jgi:hypothetical protein